MNKKIAFIFSILISVSAFAQDGKPMPKISKSLKSCTKYGKTSHLGAEGENLKCDASTILWVEGIENQKDKTKLIHENVDMVDVTKDFGKIDAGKVAITVNHREIRKMSNLQDDSKKSGSDISIDSFIISQKVTKVIKKDANGNMVPFAFNDSETELTMETEVGMTTNAYSSNYGFYPLIAFVKSNSEQSQQTILPGTVICNKPKKFGGFNAGSRTRVYVESTTPQQYCYGDSLGLDLPTDFKNGTSNLNLKLILPYSQKGPDGQEDDLVAVWPEITKKQYDAASYILLTYGKITDPKKGTEYPRVVIGLTKNPVKITK